MLYTATVEIPKGSDRRIHMKYDKSGFLDLGPISDSIPVNNGIMPVHYGYINNTVNILEGDEVDVIIFSNKIYNTGDSIGINISGILIRADGDNKIIAYDDSFSNFSFSSLQSEERDLILDYMGFKSPIIKVEDTQQATLFVNNANLAYLKNIKYPKIIRDVGFDFSWDEKKVWALNYPAEDINIHELLWHFDIPFHWWKGEVYNLTSKEILNNSNKYREEYERVMDANTSYPIDIMENKGRWVILDGLHRLMKLYKQNEKIVSVRKIPRSEIPNIVK